MRDAGSAGWVTFCSLRESPKQDSKRFNSHQVRWNTLPIWVYNLSMQPTLYNIMSLYLCTSVLSISCQKCHWSFVDGLCKTSDPSHLIRIHNSNLAQLNRETLKSKIVKVHVCETNFCFQFAKSIKTAKFSKSGNFPHKTAKSAISLSIKCDRRQTVDRRRETGDRRQETGDRRQETGDGRRDRRQETGNRKQETGKGFSLL